MKTGMLTHRYINSYGEFLQEYALLEAMKRLYPRYNSNKDSIKTYIQYNI